MKNCKKIFVLTFAILLFVTTGVYAADYVTVNNEREIANGVSFNQIKKLTDAGWLDIYLTKVDLSNETIKIEPLREPRFGRKNSVENLVKNSPSTVFSSVNSSFFDMNKAVSDSYGFEFKNSKVATLASDNNAYSSSVASLLINKDKSAKMDYFKQQGIFIKNDKDFRINAAGINRINLDKLPMVYNNNAFTDSTFMDAKGDYYKIVVDNGVVTKVAGPKENVYVPQNGFIVVLHADTANDKLDAYPVGTPVTISLGENYKLDDLEMAITGGGMIVRNGQIVDEGLRASANSRHPRTAIGLTQDGKTLLIMAVDGRGASAGATNAEMGSIMLSYGAYNAIQLDGGGSTTAVVREQGDMNASLKNKPSDKYQRRVINALAVSANGRDDKVSKVILSSNEKSTTLGKGINLTVKAVDGFSNPVAVDPSTVRFVVDDESKGSFSNSTFVPSAKGKAIVKAIINSVESNPLELEAFEDIVGFSAEPKILNVSGNNKSFVIKGFAPDMTNVFIDKAKIQYVLDDPSLGSFENGVFKPSGKTGISKVTLSYNGMSCENIIVAGEIYKNHFNAADTNANSGLVLSNGNSTAKKTVVNNDLKMDFSFAVSDKTQSLQLNLSKPIVIDENRKNLTFKLLSNNELMNITYLTTDAKGKKSELNLLANGHFMGEKTLYTTLPDNLAYPVKINGLKISRGPIKDKINSFVTIRAIVSTLKVPDNMVNSTKINKFNDITMEEMDVNVTPVLTLGDSLDPIFDMGSNLPLNGFANRQYSNFTLIDVVSLGNSIRGNGANQYVALKNAIANSPKDVVVVRSQFDVNNLKEENEKIAMKDILKNSGKKVIYLSLYNPYPQVYGEDGVRYIALTNKNTISFYDVNGEFKYLIK